MAIPPYLPTLPPPVERASVERHEVPAEVPAEAVADAARVPSPLETPPSQNPPEEVRQAAVQARMEVKLLELPDSDVFLFRVVEPDTGRVIREFPPESLTELLADLRARAAARLDQRA